MGERDYLVLSLRFRDMGAAQIDDLAKDGWQLVTVVRWERDLTGYFTRVRP